MTDYGDKGSKSWIVNACVDGLLEGEGTSEDHETVLKWLRKSGLTEEVTNKAHRALVNGAKTPCWAPEFAKLHERIEALEQNMEFAERDIRSVRNDLIDIKSL